MEGHCFLRICLVILTLLSLGGAPHARAQGVAAQTGKLIAIHVTGSKRFGEAQIAAASGLELGRTVTRDDFQAAADRLARLGLFSNVHYRYTPSGQSIILEFHVEEAPTVPVRFDNFPWFTDAELAEGLKQAVGLFDGTAPEQGAVLDAMTAALEKMLAGRGVHASVERTLMAPATGAGMVQEFKIVGPSLNIQGIEFSDPLAAESRRVRERLLDLVGKPYSRFAVEVFANEHVRPVYLEKGYLRVAIGVPSARFTGDPNRPLPDRVLVIVPITPGRVYRWAGVTWRGNEILNAAGLDQVLGLRQGEIADGMKLAAGWQRIEDEYARRGYLDAKVEPEATFDDAAGQVSYRATITEGTQYRMGELVITGLSLAAERKLRENWRISPGQIFDRVWFDEFLATGIRKNFADTPVHFEEIGHWLRPNLQTHTVDVLLDFR